MAKLASPRCVLRSSTSLLFGLKERKLLSNASSVSSVVSFPNFEDTTSAYEKKSIRDIVRSLFVLKLCSIDAIVNNHKRLTSFGGRLLPRRAFDSILKATFYGQFVAGETLDDVLATKEKYKKWGIGAILDYAVEAEVSKDQIVKSMQSISDDPSGIDVPYKAYHEFADRREPSSSARAFFYEDELKCDENLSVFLECIDSSVSKDNDGFACVKLTALGEPALLRLMSGKIHKGKSDDLHASLSPDHKVKLDRLLCRMETLSKRAEETGVRVMYDAEQTYFQPAIRWLVMNQMRKYNKTKPRIFNTYQCYLKSTRDILAQDILEAKKSNFHFAAKMVRGAYMEHERRRARKAGYPDPIHDSYENTEACYHGALERVLDAVQKDGAAVIIASHNERSVTFALKAMEERGIAKKDLHVSFAQLLGMSDHLSYLLGKHGCRVYKYMPYGPVRDVVPYLGRRAEENRSIMKGATKERGLLWTELKRRISKWQ